jgi:peroxiredoxin
MTMTLPDWQATTPDGAEAPLLSNFQGNPLLILFYSMGCPGCWSRAIPVTLQLRSIYPELQIVAIHTHFERPKHSPSEILAAIREKGVDYPVLIDRDTETASLYQAEGTPHWILVGRDGELLKSIFGSMPNALQRLDLSLRELFQ